jgi:hypothetical protein
MVKIAKQSPGGTHIYESEEIHKTATRQDENT